MQHASQPPADFAGRKPRRRLMQTARSATNDLLRIIANATDASWRVLRNVGLRGLRRSDHQRWCDPAKLETWWETRTEKIARLIPTGKRVLEFGAGRGYLAKYLDAASTYFPCDLTSRGPETIVFDLNRRPLPDLRHLRADVAVFAGVLEYLHDLDSLVSWLAAQVNVCVVSYTCVASVGKFTRRIRENFSRRYYGYMNGFGEDELIGLFRRAGFNCDARDTWTNQCLIRFVRNPLNGSS